MPVTRANRLCSTRNQFTRTLVLAAIVVFLVCVTIRNSRNNSQARNRVMMTADRMAVPPPPTVPVQTPLEPESANAVLNDADLGTPLDKHRMNCDINMQHLRQVGETYGLSGKIEYFKRYVRFHRKPIERLSYTNIDQKLLPRSFQKVDLNSGYVFQECAEPLEVPVTQSPYPADVNLSEFMFAVSTTFSRINNPASNPIKEWAFWLTNSNGRPNGGKMLLQLIDATVAELDDVARRLARAGIDADVSHTDSRLEMAVRYLGLVPMLYNHRERPNKKWLVMCDDDTYFPNMHALKARFEKYDHKKLLYIGTLSEDVGAIERHGSQAFGGAGVFLSVSMAEKITDIFATCRSNTKIREADSGWGPQGDILLRKCIYENTNVRLTQLWDLWQLDLFGDPAGFYEGGIKPYSVHHFKGGGWHFAYPFQSTKIAHACGEDCSYQRFVTTDNFVISNGFSVAHYPQGIDFDLDQFEGTFHAAPEDRGWNLDWMYGPQRPSMLRTGKKIAWELRESYNNPDGSVLQTYIRRADDVRWVENDKPLRTHDGVIELVWIPA
ncbi:hypothetical protein HYQ44_001732 [Verticillium longisporum]|nr:hypothetical protein HYQ44_001732 [Verticillium longisporum]